MQLTRRTNVLLTEEDYKLIENLSRKERKTMGQLIRTAIKKAYKKESKNQAKSVSADIQKGWSLLINPKKKIDYKDLIEYGRK